MNESIYNTVATGQLALSSALPTTVEFLPVLHMVDQFQNVEDHSRWGQPHRLLSGKGIRSQLGPDEVTELAVFMARYGAQEYKVPDPPRTRWDRTEKLEVIPLWVLKDRYELAQVRRFYMRTLGWLSTCADLDQAVAIVPVVDRSKMIKISGPLLGDPESLRKRSVRRSSHL